VLLDVLDFGGVAFSVESVMRKYNISHLYKLLFDSIFDSCL